MSKRGKILRDPTNGPGLVVVDGRQYTFPLEGVWKSSSLPQPGVVVDVEFATDDTIDAVTAVPESQLAREQAEQALQSARQKGSALASTAMATFGLPTLLCTAALVLGWFFFSTISVDTGFAGSIHFTFWRVLTLVNSSNALEAMQSAQGGGSAGIYGLLAIVALAGPYLGALWKDKRAAFGGLLPLLFMVLIALLVRNSLASASSGVPSEIMDEMRKEISKQISVGIGCYLSILAALYLGFLSVKKFLAERARG